MTTNGKGDKQRPTDKARFDKNFGNIDWSKKRESAPKQNQSPEPKPPEQK